MSKLTIPQRQSNQDDATYAQIVQNSIREQRPYLSDDDILSLAQVKISTMPSVQPSAQPKAQAAPKVEVAKVEKPQPFKSTTEMVDLFVPKQQVVAPKTLAEVARGLANKKVVTDPMESGVVARQETIKRLPEQPAIMPSLGDPNVAAGTVKMLEKFIPPQQQQEQVAPTEVGGFYNPYDANLPTQENFDPTQAQRVRQNLPQAQSVRESFIAQPQAPQVDVFDVEAEKQLPKGSPNEKMVYADVLRKNDDKIKTFEASKAAAQTPTDDFEATINKKDLSFGNTQRASLMKAKLGGDMTAIESSLNEYQETPEFKRDVIKASNGNKAKFKEAAQLVLDNKANEYAFAPTKLQKKMQQFSDWAASPDAGLDNFDPIYIATKTLGAGLKGFTDVGAFGAALIGGTARSMGQVLDSKEVTMLDNFAAANAKAQKMSSGYIPQVQSEKASGLTQGLSDVTSIVAAIGAPMSVVKPVSIFGKAKNLLSLGTRGESAIAKGLSAEAQLAARATSGANKTLLEAAKVLQSKPANMVAQVLDGAATNWAIMGSSSFDGQRQKYLDMGFTEEQANRRAFGMTSLTNLLLAMPGVLRPHEASITQKIFSTGSKKETLKASLKQAAYFGGDMTLLRSIENTLDDNAKREQGIKIENTPFSELIKENGKKALVDAGAGFVMGLMARGKYKQSEMQLNGIVEAFKNPEQLSLDVQKDVANGRMTKEQAKTFQDFLTTIEPQYQKTLNETTEINGVQSPRFTPQTAVKIAIEKTKSQQAAEALKNLNASVETKTIYETDKNGNIVEKTVYRHKDGKLYETEEASTKGRRISLLATKTNAEQRARRLEAGYNIENKLVAGWEMADLVDNNSLNGKAKEGQREAIMANAPYEAVEINVNDFAKQPEIQELVSQIESGKLDVTNVEENNIAPPTIDAEGNVIDGKKIVAKAIVESAFERGGGKITFMKPITNEAYTEAANEAFESKVGDTAPKLTDKNGKPFSENEKDGINGMAGVFNKVIENGGDAAEGLVEAAKEGLQTFVEPQVVAERLKDIKGEDTFSEPIIEAAVREAQKPIVETASSETQNLENDGRNKPESVIGGSENKAIVKNNKGEDVEFYHGTPSEFEDFDMSKLGENTKAESAKEGIFFSNNQNVAESYRKQSEYDNPNIEQAESELKKLTRNELISISEKILYNRSKKYYEGEGAQEIIDDIIGEIKDDLSESFYQDRNKYIEKLSKELYNKGVKLEPYKKQGKLFSVKLKMSNPFVFDAKENFAEDIGLVKLIKTAKKNGHDGVIVKNTYDSVSFGEKGNDTQLSDIAIVFDKNQIVFKESQKAEQSNVRAVEANKKTQKAKTVAQLRAEEKAEMAATDPNDKEALDEIYNRYDKLITPLLEKEKAAAREKGVKDMSVAEKMRQKAAQAEEVEVVEGEVNAPNEEVAREKEQPKSKLEVASSKIRDAAAKLREEHQKELDDPNAIQRQGGLSKKQVAVALEKIADIIDTVKDVEKAIKQFLDGIKDPKERTEYEKEINNFFLEEYGEKEEVKPVPFAEIPKARLDEVMIEGEEKVDKTFANRVIASKAEEAAKVAVANQGLERVVDNFAIAEINANNLVEKYGYDIALSKAIEGEIDGAARSAILGMEYLRRDDAVRVANTATELRKATEDLAEWVSYIGYLQAKGGSANAYWGKFYADNPNLGLTLKDKIDQWAATAGKATPIDIREKYEKIDAELKTALERVKELEAQKPSDEMMSVIKSIQKQTTKGGSKLSTSGKEFAAKIRKLKVKPIELKDADGNPVLDDKGKPVVLQMQGLQINELIEIAAKAAEKSDSIIDGFNAIRENLETKEWFKKLTKKDKESIQKQIEDAFESSMNDESVEANPITNSVIRDYVKQGFNTPEALLEKLMEHYPNKSEREVRDMVSKYGQEITKTADEIDREIRLIKNVFKTKSQLEDIAQGIRPKKRILPVILTPAEKAAEEIRKAKERKMVKDVRQALDNMDVDLPTLDNELRTKLDKQEATLSNKIKDLELALESGKEITKNEKTKLTSEEIEKLELQLEDTRKIYNEVFGKDTKSQKVPYSLEAVDSAIDANEFKLKGAQADLEVVRKRGQDISKIEADIERYKNNAKTLEGLKTELESIEAKRVLQTFKNLAKRKEYYEQRKASGQYAKKPKNVLPLTTELTKALSEVDRLKFEEQKLLYLAEKESMSGTAKVGELVGGLWNVPRLTLATGEWSFVGMQGRRLAASYLIKNPSVLKDAFKNAAKSWVSGEFAQEMESRIKNNPEYHIHKSAGVDYTEQSFKTKANEEIAYNNIGKIFWRFLNAPDVIAEKMYKLKTGKDLGLVEEIDKFNPLVKFERSASGFLNTLRYAAMSDMIAVFKQEGLSFEKNKQDYKSAANYINSATGRGGSGIEAFQKNAEVLSKFFFSPKMFMTELQLGTSPLGLAYILSMKDPSNIAKREAFKHQLRYMSVLLGAGVSATMLAYLKMGRTDDNDDGTGVEFNPASTNYGKIVFPNGRTVDFFNGAQRYIVLYDRLFGQEKFKNREGVIKDVGVKGSPSKYDIIMNIPKNKLNPALGFVTGALDAQSRKLVGTEKYDDFGQVWDTEEEAKKLASPIFFQMVNNAYEQDPTILDGIGLFGAFFGKGFSVEEKKAPKPPKVRKRKSNYGFRYNP
jgi:hypothetical protein